MSDAQRSVVPARVDAVPAGNAAIPADSEAIYHMVKRSEINPYDVEDASAQTVEVTVQWRLAVLHVAHLQQGHGFVLTSRSPTLASPSRRMVPGLAAGAVAVLAGATLGGAAAGAIAAVGAVTAAMALGVGVAAQVSNEVVRNDPTRFVVDASMLFSDDDVPVVIDDGVTQRFVFPRGCRGEVEIDGVRRSIAELTAQGHARSSDMLDGAHEVVLLPGGRYRLEVGGVSVSARVVHRARKVVGRGRRDPVVMATGVGAALAVAVGLGALTFAASDGSGLLSAEDHDTAMADLRAFLRTQSEQQEPVVQASSQSPGVTGTAHEGAAGAAGLRAAPPADHRYAIRHRDPEPHLANQISAREAVSQRGIFIGLGPAAPTSLGGPMASPFSAMTTASGNDAIDATGHMNGALPGDADGYNGLDTVGTGWGGGGDGHGTVGTGRVGTQGHGNCLPGEDCAYGQGHGILHAPPREGHGPIIRAQAPEVSGIAPDVIRRVVLRNIGQVNRCYEQGLATNPTLTGRVAVRFVIGGGGSVLASAVAQDNLGVPTVSACIADAVRRWNFPVPETSGPITVTYPFSLMPAD